MSKNILQDELIISVTNVFDEEKETFYFFRDGKMFFNNIEFVDFLVSPHDTFFELIAIDCKDYDTEYEDVAYYEFLCNYKEYNCEERKREFINLYRIGLLKLQNK